jgi:uncharacterized protein YjbJ (UPF0337 family)
MGIGRKAKHAAAKGRGKVKKATGDATDNRDLEAEGRAEEVAADVEEAAEKAKDTRQP